MAISPKQIGVCSWSLKPSTPQDLIDDLSKVGLSTIQLALSELVNEAEGWDDTPQQLADAGVHIISGMFGAKGENYSTLDTIRQTGGVILDSHWDANWANAKKIAKLVSRMNLKEVSTHAGFLPQSKEDPNFDKMLGRLKQIADLLHESAGATLLFETGQETADTLWQFLDALEAAGTRNIKVNFDPANMILYAKGDPIASLKKLLPRVAQVHIKDAVKTQIPGTWGKEVAAGKGEVDWPAFVEVLKQADFQGGLIIEREAGETRIPDVKSAAELMKKLIV